MSSPDDINQIAWDRMVRAGQPFTRPARDQDFANPLRSLDLAGWLPETVNGRQVLCLAAGGGRQSVLFAAAGAAVTVVDLSPAMLALDRQAAAERGLNVQTIQTTMTDLGMLKTADFDLVYQPVSSCYVSSVVDVYRQISRILKSGGLYISQHKQPASLQASDKLNSAGHYEIVRPYYRTGELPPVCGTMLREEGTKEFLHRWEELIGGLCRCGFVVEDLIEPVHADAAAQAGAFGHRGRYLAPYVRIKARRLGNAAHRSSLWTPSR